MFEVPEDRLIALLALAQSAALIDHVAATGTVHRPSMDHLLDCLFGLRDDASGTGLGDAACYPIGRRTLLDICSGDLPDNQVAIPSYMRAMIRQERKLARHPGLREEVTRRLARAEHMRTHYTEDPTAVHAAVAGAYLDTLSRLNVPVTVTGALRQIVSRHNANLIRTAILGGVQAAGAWRRHGGRPWQLRWQKRRLLTVLRSLPAPRQSDPVDRVSHHWLRDDRDR